LSLLIPVVIVFFGYGIFRITSDPIQRWDEYTNIRVVEDTIQSNDFLTLKYDDSSTGYFLEKPPLWYWTGIIISQISPLDTYINLRLISFFSFIGILYTMFLIVRNFYQKNLSIYGVFMFFLIPHLFIINPAGFFSTHTLYSADLDFLQILFMMIASLYFYKSINLKDDNKSIIVGGFFSGLAFLTKGPIGLVPLISYCLFLLINFITQKDWSEIIKIFKVTLTTLLLIIPWVIISTLNYGNLWIEEFWNYHILERMAQPIEGHYGWKFGYMQLFLNPFVNLTGIFVLIGGGYLIIKKKFEILKNFNLFFSLLSFALIYVIIEITQTKIAWYLLPIYPFGVLIIVNAIQQLGIRNDE
jgi:4-amino-4-deoxy-L-arabinose transferase-like glycosyltransferase